MPSLFAEIFLSFRFIGYLVMATERISGWR